MCTPLYCLFQSFLKVSALLRGQFMNFWCNGAESAHLHLHHHPHHSYAYPGSEAGVFDQLREPKVKQEQCQSAGHLWSVIHCYPPKCMCLVVDQFAYGNSNRSLETAWRYWRFSINCDHWAQNLQFHLIPATVEHLELFLGVSPKDGLLTFFLKCCIKLT